MVYMPPSDLSSCARRTCVPPRLCFKGLAGVGVVCGVQWWGWPRSVRPTLGNLREVPGHQRGQRQPIQERGK